MNTKTLGVVGALILAAGGAVVVGTQMGGKDTPTIEVAMVAGVDEAQVAPRVIMVQGKPVRVVTSASPFSDVQDSPVGRVVVVTTDSNMLCSVLLEAEENSLGQPDIQGYNFQHLRPVKFPQSESWGDWLWWVVLQGDDCLRVATEDGYLGSTMEEFVGLPASIRNRFLVTAEDGSTYFPIEIAGRADLSFPKAKNGRVIRGYEREVVDAGVEEVEPIEQPVEVPDAGLEEVDAGELEHGMSDVEHGPVDIEIKRGDS